NGKLRPGLIRLPGTAALRRELSGEPDAGNLPPVRRRESGSRHSRRLLSYSTSRLYEWHDPKKGLTGAGLLVEVARHPPATAGPPNHRCRAGFLSGSRNWYEVALQAAKFRVADHPGPTQFRLSFEYADIEVRPAISGPGQTPRGVRSRLGVRSPQSPHRWD